MLVAAPGDYGEQNEHQDRPDQECGRQRGAMNLSCHRGIIGI